MASNSVRVSLCWLHAVGFLLLFFSEQAIADSGGKFDSYEIRVIRPKFFKKSGRIGVGAQLDTIMNQAFIYTYMATGILSYHFNESWGLEGRSSIGTSIDKDDKRLLEDEFEINTIILRTFSSASLRLSWTPVYGKFQLESGRIVYFDTYLNAGAGLTGIEYLYDHCRDPSELPEEKAANLESPPAKTTKQYPTIVGGIGQRFFPARDLSMRLGIDFHQFFYDQADGSCSPSRAVSNTKNHNNILLGIGVSKWY